MPYFDLVKLRVTILTFTNKDMDPFRPRGTLDLARYSDRIGIKLKQLDHYQTYAFQMTAGTESSSAKAGYEAMCLYSLNFLSRYLKAEAQSAEFLQRPPEKNGIASDILSLEIRAGGPPPPPKTSSLLSRSMRAAWREPIRSTGK